ncbi:sushi domain-containing protein 1-like isoform X3, partial [Elysia marginata]
MAMNKLARLCRFTDANCLLPALFCMVAVCTAWDMDTMGWHHVRLHPGSRVVDLPTWVELRVPNARACVRMCWLYSACSALTFSSDQRVCQIYRTDGDHAGIRTETLSGSLAVDMSTARIDSNQRNFRYGCHTRPCKTTELCAPVKNAATYVCILLIKDSSQTDFPVIPNSITEYDGFSSVVYTCAHGYFRRGSSYISTFHRDSHTWSSVDVTCAYVDCGAPPVLHGAQSSGSGTAASSVVTYSCLDGAVPSNGQIEVTCEGSTGQWSSPQGSCSAVICGQPPAVDTLISELMPRSTADAFPGLDTEELKMAFGGQAHYTCKPDNSNLTYIKSGDREFEAIYTCHTGYVFDS